MSYIFASGLPDINAPETQTPEIKVTGEFFVDKDMRNVGMVTRDRLGLTVKELLKTPTSYNHRKVVVKIVKTLQALLTSNDLISGFSILENFVEVYKDAGKRELGSTFGICAPQIAYDYG